MIQQVSCALHVGGLLDLAEFPVSFPLEHIRRRPATLWRYQEALPFAPSYTGWQSVTMGEGFTPLVPLKGHSSHVLFKLDYLMPTLSFKRHKELMTIQIDRFFPAAILQSFLNITHQLNRDAVDQHCSKVGAYTLGGREHHLPCHNVLRSISRSMNAPICSNKLSA